MGRHNDNKNFNYACVILSYSTDKFTLAHES